MSIQLTVKTSSQQLQKSVDTNQTQQFKNEEIIILAIIVQPQT